MRKRMGDCSRKRRFCFASNPAKAAFYAAHRSRRFARRFFNAEALPLSSETEASVLKASCVGVFCSTSSRNSGRGGDDV